MEGMEGLLVVILLFWVLPALFRGKKGGKKQQSAQQSAQATSPAAQRQDPSIQLHRPAPSMQRQAAKNPAHRDFRAPEAPCIVCEQTGDDHFQRDKARRIAQLDDWLKNGLIDRSEYLLLKDRYQRGI